MLLIEGFIMSLYVKEIRGVVNSEITNEFASNMGTMIGNFLKPGKNVVVGRDTSLFSQMIKRSITAGLMASGIGVIDFGVAPIPTVHYGASLYDTDVIITITASHLRPDEIAIKIFSDYEIQMAQKHAEQVPWDKIGYLSYVYDYVDKYLNAVLENVEKGIIRNMRLKVVVDCANASTVPFMPQLLNVLGCETILFGCQTTETSSKMFAEPTPETLSMVSDLVKSTGADLGMALDNDGDRIIFIDEKGKIIRDQTVLGIFARESLIKNPGGTVVSSVVASRALDETVLKYEGNLIKAPVDLVLNKTIENKAVFGGDEPGMYIFPEFQDCFDAIFTGVKMIETICKQNKTLSQLAREIPEYHRTGFSIECEHENKEDVLNNLKENLEEKGVSVTTDGIRIDWENAYVLVRPSRFEPLMRVYIESKTSKRLDELSNELKNMIQDV
jgi:phosphomannomutase